ncbi:MAG: glycosyltransferase family 2 protein [Pseudoramibacter sp.]
MGTDKQIKTSVAMCTYNGSRFLEEQLNSIVGQSYPPDEIVICDDGSSDNTLSIAENCLRDWPGTVHLEQNQKNLGFVKNFEKAIGLCHGDIIFLSDQDDVWHRDKIKIMMQTFEKHPEAAMVFHDAELVNQDLKLLYPSFWNNTLEFDYLSFLHHNYERLYARNVVQGSACAFKKQVYEKAVPFYGDFHDEWLARVALTIGDLVPVPKILMQYRQAFNEVGGIPSSASEQTKEVMKNTKQRYLNDIKKYQNNLMVINTLIKRYHIEQNGYPLDLIGYSHFLEKRIEALKQRKISQIFALKQYRKYLCKYKKSYLKSYLKDIYEILFRK